MPRRHGLVAAPPLLGALLFAAVPAHAARAPAMRDLLSGVWQVERRCLTGCSQSQTSMTTVTPQGHDAFLGLGGLQPLEIYQISTTQVIAHAARASSLLTIRSAGRYMTGLGIGNKGETFVSTWRCVAALPGRGSSPGTSARCGT